MLVGSSESRTTPMHWLGDELVTRASSTISPDWKLTKHTASRRDKLTHCCTSRLVAVVSGLTRTQELRCPLSTTGGLCHFQPGMPPSTGPDGQLNGISRGLAKAVISGYFCVDRQTESSAWPTRNPLSSGASLCRDSQTQSCLSLSLTCISESKLGSLSLSPKPGAEPHVCCPKIHWIFKGEARILR